MSSTLEAALQEHVTLRHDLEDMTRQVGEEQRRAALLESENVSLRSELHMYREQLSRAVLDRDHYMRFATEIVSGMNQIRRTIDDLDERARAAVYARNNPAPPQRAIQQAVVGDIPGFLREGPAEQEDITDVRVEQP